MAAIKIRELPEEDRPREKLLKHGADGLTNRELIAILLRTGVPGKNAVEVGGEILEKYKTLSDLSRISARELENIRGVGLAKAVQLAAAFKLADRMSKEKLVREKIDSPELVNDFFGAEMRALQKESLRVILLDTRYRLIDTQQISLGSVNESIAHPREVFRPALLASAYAIIVVHNHPSGDPAPSSTDHSLTRRLAEAADLLQIRLLDHVIIGSPADGRAPYFSFKEAGVL
ncbi:MAG TPA: DNA repair protein RadC [Chthoniobacterales bacterium]|nr:DNA repair protein RadC [Chthoniobacterales bacterium]